MLRLILELFLFGFSALLLVNSVNSAPLDGERIQGGEDAELGNFPYQVSIQFADEHICGGSIIDRKHIVTAAHCVMYTTGYFMRVPLEVVAGINDLNDKTSTVVSIGVEQVYVPKEYNHEKTDDEPIGDIAVLKLKEPLDIDSNANIGIIDLPELTTTDFNVKANVSGFGVNSVKLRHTDDDDEGEEYDEISYGKLRFAEADAIGSKECQAYYQERLSTQHICAFVEQRDLDVPEGVCSGDSGGPLAYGNVLIGVISNSPVGCREDSRPAIYTRVSSFIDFIKKAVSGKFGSEIRTAKLPTKVVIDYK